MQDVAEIGKTLELGVDEYMAELSRRKLSFFVQEFWSVIIQDELVWSPHMEVLCEELQTVYERTFLRFNGELDEEGKPKKTRLPKLYDLIINIPPGTSKSTICTIMAPAWAWANDQSLRVITGSYSDSLSTEHAVKTRDIVRSDKFRKYFPEIEIKKDEDNKTNYKTTQNGQRFATSVGGTITGVHAHILQFDDPINPKQAASEAELKNANDFFDKTLPTRKVDKAVTPIILIMQRLAEDDPSGHLLAKKKEGIRHIKLPASLKDFEGNENEVKPAEYKSIYVDNLLDPVRMGQGVLTELKTELGSAGYAAQMDQNAIPAAGILLKKNWFQIVDKPIPENRMFQLDTAYTEDKKNDPSAILDYYKEGNDIYITNAQSVLLEFPDLISFLKSYFPNAGYKDGSKIHVEPKASGKSVVQQVKSETNFNIIESKPPDKDKRARVVTVSPKIESGRIKLHRGAWNQSFIDQCCSFPIAAHDDELDCLVAIIFRELLNEKGYSIPGVGEF